MTEAEAKTKMCPLMLIASLSPDAADTMTYLCHGSECMMWRVTGPTLGSVSGYCGLAGKPA